MFYTCKSVKTTCFSRSLSDIVQVSAENGAPKVKKGKKKMKGKNVKSEKGKENASVNENEAIGNAPKSFKTVEVEQNEEYGMTVENMQKFCEWSRVKDYAFILHNKETHLGVAPNGHMMIRFLDSVPTTAILAKLNKCGITAEVQQLNKMHSWCDAIAYLTHSNKPEKVQYPDEDVYSNFEWKEDRKKALDRKALKRDPSVLLKIQGMIETGELKEYNIAEKISLAEYNTYHRDIINCFEYRSKKVMKEANTQAKNEKVNVIWLYGNQGTGKTAYAKFLCEHKNLDFYVSESGKDPLGGYMGQPALILDDVRPDVFKPDTLLKMLDPHTRSGVASRYRNKWLEVEMILVTCNLSPEEWWREYQKESGTAGKWQQLTRRINGGCFNFNNMTMRLYDAVGNVQYEFGIEIPEEVKLLMNKPVETPEEVVERLNNMLGGMKIVMKNSNDKRKDDVSSDKTSSFDNEQVNIDDLFPEAVEGK